MPDSLPCTDPYCGATDPEDCVHEIDRSQRENRTKLAFDFGVADTAMVRTTMKEN